MPRLRAWAGLFLSHRSPIRLDAVVLCRDWWYQRSPKLLLLLLRLTRSFLTRSLYWIDMTEQYSLGTMFQPHRYRRFVALLARLLLVTYSGIRYLIDRNSDENNFLAPLWRSALANVDTCALGNRVLELSRCLPWEQQVVKRRHEY